MSLISIINYILNQKTLIKNIKANLTKLSERGFKCEVSKNKVFLSYQLPSDTINLDEMILLNEEISYKTINYVSSKIDEYTKISQPNSFISEALFDRINKLYTQAKSSPERKLTLELSSHTEIDYLILTDLDNLDGYLFHPLYTKQSQVNDVMKQIEKLLMKKGEINDAF